MKTDKFKVHVKCIFSIPKQTLYEMIKVLTWKLWEGLDGQTMHPLYHNVEISSNLYEN